jgi:hypothetical protein
VLYDPWLTEPVEDAGMQLPEGEEGAGEQPEKKEQKGFIPGFEVTMLLSAIGVCALLIRKKRI